MEFSTFNNANVSNPIIPFIEIRKSSIANITSFKLYHILLMSEKHTILPSNSIISPSFRGI